MTIHSESGLKGFVLPFVVPSLVVTRNADLLLLDDMKARRAATSWGLTITGILEILDQAATMKLIDLSTAVQSLQNTSFWASNSLFQRLLNKHS